MNIIIGASGQVGSHIVKELKAKNMPVRAVVRNPEKLTISGIDTAVADLFNADELISVFEGGKTAFLLTPEDPGSNDIIGDTKQIVANYKEAIRATGINKVVALSCVGVQVEGKTGNILMSRILEQELDGLDIDKAFIRPSYYYSNWLGYLDAVEEGGTLPSFFPANLKIDMNSPLDVAKFVSEIIERDKISHNKMIFELSGPQKYDSNDVAETFSRMLNKNVEVFSIPENEWQETLKSAGFTENTAQILWI